MYHIANKSSASGLLDWEVPAQVHTLFYLSNLVFFFLKGQLPQTCFAPALNQQEDA